MVAIQPGHWKVEELPDELYRLRGSTGTAWGTSREVEINVNVAQALTALVRSKGWLPVLVPATVPPSLIADAFLSIHVDGSSDTGRQGWKLAPPWRASPASQELGAALTRAFAAQPDFFHDEWGITINMRGYYGFSHRRFTHSASPYTPAVLVELGYLSNARDRKLLLSDPGRFAAILLSGLESYFASRPRAKVDDLAPRVFPSLVVASGGVSILAGPREGARTLAKAEAGTAINPVGEQGDWYEVSLRNPRVIGWMPKSSLLPRPFGVARPR